MDENEPLAEEGGSAGLPTELLKSYLAFAKRALTRHWVVSAGVFAVIACLTGLVAKFWPRTYRCEARMMADYNEVLASHGARGSGLRNAADTILRHENLEAIIKQTDLVHVSASRRPVILHLKDRIIEKLGGKMSDEDAARALVWTIEQKVSVDASEQALTLGAEWADPQTSALLVQALLDNYLDSRHVAEISTIAEYISILESHATTLRNEVQAVANQIQEAKKEKRDAAKQKLAAVRDAKKSTASDPAPVVVRRPVVTLPQPDEDAPRIKVLLEGKKQAIAELEAGRNRRLAELQGKMDELRTKYTAAHPVMEDLQQQINALSHESPQVASLRTEVRDLEAQQSKKAATGAITTSILSSGVRPGNMAAAAGESGGSSQLPDEIMNLLNSTGSDDVDPAVGAQFGYAVAKFSTLRSQISEARIELDTAQAAFNRRYKVVSPPEVPGKPIKPKVPVIVGAGVVLALVFGFFAAIGVELREGKIVEKWQVQQLALPILAELQFPPSSTND